MSSDRDLPGAVLACVAHAVVVAGPDGRVAYGNAAAHGLFGWLDGQMAGAPLESLFGMAEPAAAGKAARVRCRRRDGTPFSATVAATPLPERPGGPAGTVLAVTRSDTAAIIHDMNQPLHVIRLAAEALEMGLGLHPDAREQVAARAETILAQVDRLTDVLQRLAQDCAQD